MSRWYPERSYEDAVAALDELDHLGDAWLAVWARRAMAAALLANEEPEASVLAIQRALDGQMSPSERAQCQLLLGEGRLALGRADEAGRSLAEAEHIFEGLGARYWQARALVLLARADPAAGTSLQRRARALSDGDESYEALFAAGSRLELRLLDEPAVVVDGERRHFRTRRRGGRGLRPRARRPLGAPRGHDRRPMLARLPRRAPVRPGPHPALARPRGVDAGPRLAAPARAEGRRGSTAPTWTSTCSGCGPPPQQLLREAHPDDGRVEQVAAALTRPLLVPWQEAGWVVDEQQQLAGLAGRLRARHPGATNSPG